MIQLPDSTQFVIRDCQIAGDECILIFPKEIGIDWNDENKIFRSSIWRESDGFPVSLSWKKFHNLTQCPEFEPLNNLENVEYFEKKDGSTLIVSKYKNQLIHRSRGTVDVRILENGGEIDFLIKKYPKVFENAWLNSEKYSFLFEWYSPKNIIVLREADEPTLWLCGIIKHEDYSYFPQGEVDLIATQLEVARPKKFEFDSIEKMVESVKLFQNCEGIVIYAENGQILKKSKAEKYLLLHKLKSTLSSENNLIDLFLQLNRPTYDKFYSHIEKTFDFEIAETVKDTLQKICDKYCEIELKIEQIKTFIGFRILPENDSRKDQAAQIIQNYQDIYRSIAFMILDGREIDDKVIKRLLIEK